MAALAAAACGSADDSASAPEAASADEAPPADEYLEAVALAWAPLVGGADAGFLDLESASLSGDEAEVLESAEAAVTEARSAVATTRADLTALDPPAAHSDDHARLDALLGELDGWLDGLEATVADGGVDTLSRARADLGRLVGGTFAELSVPMTARLAVATGVATRYPELSEDDVAYLSGVNEAVLEFGELNAAFGQAINRSYTNSTLLLEALLDAGVGQGFVAQREEASALEPTEAFEGDHDEYLSYLDEVVAIDDQARQAAENGDIIAFNVANTQLAVAGAALSGRTTEPFREARGEVPLPADLPGGDFGVALVPELGRTDSLLAGAQGPVTPYQFIGVVTDGERVAATTGAAPIIAAELAAIRDRVAALEPPPTLAADHEIVVAYLDDLVESHADIEAEAAIGRLVTTWCTTASDLSADFAPLVAAHFGPTTGDSRCG